MSKTIIALDCMGGDNAPGEIVKGAVLAANENKDMLIKLVGREDDIKKELEKYPSSDKLEIVDAKEVIETGEPPVAAIRKKKDSSLVKCMYMVKKGEADAMVSAGSTGANLVGGHVIIGRIKGVERPPLAPLIPTKTGFSLLIDCGANVDARPSHLLQFAKMGSVYMENVVGVKNPKVALVNIGAEEEKGNALVKETYPLLKEMEGINFIGNIEARDIPNGDADVIVCDAFVGNVILKLYEGVASVLIKKDLKKTLKGFSLEEHGGAPLLGLNGLLVKTHGSSKAIEIKNSILQCITFNELDINNKFKEKLSLESKED